MHRVPQEVFQIRPPSTNVLGRTFYLSNKLYGSGVVVDHKNEVYLITADHLLTEPYDGLLKFKMKEGWSSFFPHKLISRCKESDVAILKLEHQEYFSNMFSKIPLPLNSVGVHLGQHVHFLGFPLKIEEYIKYKLFENRPYPIAKGAILSLISEGKLMLDGMNNTGFSGGPIVFYFQGKHNVCGIVTHYREERRDVDIDYEEWATELKAIYRENTGIMYGCDAQAIKKMIESS